MKTTFTLLLGFFSCFLYAQEVHSKLDESLLKDNNLMMFSYKEDSYIMSSDSLYTISKKPMEVSTHGLDLLKYVFVSDENNGFLVNASAGMVFSFDGEKFNRLDNSFEFKSQYDHFPFIRNNAFHTFGGYGLFTYKNIITRFNPQLRETELVRAKNSIEEIPPGMYRPIAQLNKNSLYVTAGEIYNYKANSNQFETYLNEVWAFDFDNSQWFYKGKLNTDLSTAWAPETIFTQDALYFNKDHLVFLDFSRNELTRYLQPGVPIESIVDLTYNKNLGGYFYLKRITKFKKELHFIDRSDFLGTLKEVDKIYSQSIPWTIYVIIVLTFILILVLIKKRKRTFESRIRKNYKPFYSTLTTKEKEVLDMLLTASPDYVSFPSLMALYNQDLSYDSLKKKLRSTLDSLDQKLLAFFKFKRVSCLEERKCIEDARVKEIRLMP